MSTLTTRIAGYKVLVRPATQEEIESHKATCVRMGWNTLDSRGYSRAVHAEFVSDTGDVMDLPFELRATIMTVNPEFVLGFMAQHVEDLNERVEQVAQEHGYAWGTNHMCDGDCDSCLIADQLSFRKHTALRGNSNSWNLAGRKARLGAKSNIEPPAPETYVDVTYQRRTGRTQYLSAICCEYSGTVKCSCPKGEEMQKARMAYLRANLGV